MLIKYRDLERKGFHVAHDEAAGTISIHLSQDPNGVNICRMADDVQDVFDLSDMARDVVYGEFLRAVETQVILKEIS